jgi:hypothetical protein
LRPRSWGQAKADAEQPALQIRLGRAEELQRRRDDVTNTVNWASSNHTLPNSLFLKAAPSFFTGDTWPWVDPTGSTKLHTLPAKLRYDAGTPFTP